MTCDDIRVQKGGRRVDRVKADRILRTAWSLYVKHGPNAVPIEAVAAASRVSKVTVYKHFENGRALLRAVVASKLLELSEMFPVEAFESGRAGLEEDLRAAGVATLDYLRASPFGDLRFILMHEGCDDPELVQAFEDGGPGRLVDALAQLLGPDRGRPPNDEAVERARTLLALWTGPACARPCKAHSDAPIPEAVTKRVDGGIALFMRAYGLRG